jgi:hypothetical protein
MVLKQAADPGVSQSFTFICNHCSQECKQSSPPEYVQTIIEISPGKYEGAKYQACTDCNRLIQAYIEEEEYKQAERELGKPIKRNHKPAIAATLKKQETLALNRVEAETKAEEPAKEVKALTNQVEELKNMVAQLLKEREPNGATSTRSKKPTKNTKAKAKGRTGRTAKRVPGNSDSAASTEANGKGH